MLSKFLVKKFIKDTNDPSNEKTRTQYGFLAGIVGIITNFLLFLVKLFVGLFSHSIAVTADAFNNLSDAASSFITIVGFKMASKPADKEHPFGHGRVEYLSGLMVSFMVMIVGVQFIKSSTDRIVNPSKIVFEIIPFILMLLSILVKIWLSRFNSFIGKTINSSALKASSLDALGDVITTSTVVLSLILSNFTTLPIDGIIGVIVALFILYSGYSLVKDTISPLLGEAPSEKLVDNIINGVLSYEYITGVHDLIIHNYGPHRCMASIHAEVPADMSVLKIHEVIDRAEKELSEKLNIFLVIHMDPVNTDDVIVNAALVEVLKISNKLQDVKSIHDFRVVGEGENKNLIFDVVVEQNILVDDIYRNKLKDLFDRELHKIHPNYNCVITVDRDFISM